MARVALVFVLLCLAAGGAFARGGGGCFVEGTRVLTPGGEVPIESLVAGDTVIAESTERGMLEGKVLDRVELEAPGFLLIETEDGILRVTEEHPISLGDGEFKMARALRVGDRVARVEGRLSRVTRVSGISTARRVHNLVTSWPGTFAAGGVWTHNKGCFLPDTPVLLADGRSRPISELSEGDEVRAFTVEGRLVSARVRKVFAVDADSFYELRTAAGLAVRVTAEHPFYVGDGRFVTVERLRAGDRVFVFRDGLLEDRVAAIERVARPVRAYNLMTDSPNTFVAGSFAVHNKGGGGGGGFGGYGHRSSHVHTRGDGTCYDDRDPSRQIPCQTGSWFGLFGCVAMAVTAFFIVRGKRTQELDYCYPLAEVKPKDTLSRQQLAVVARVQPLFAVDQLEGAVARAFPTLQTCWQARDYRAMAPLVFDSLRVDHEAQLAGLIRNHEINRIEGVTTEWLAIAQFEFHEKADDCVFTALIQARAKDFYVDDRTQAFLRGDTEPASFQEFWVFQLHGGQWLLREIDQSRESDALKRPNVIVGAPKATERPQAMNKVEAQAQTLAARDPAWEPEHLKALARQAALGYFLCAERGDWGLFTEKATPEFLARLEADARAARDKGEQFEFRNLCVRGLALSWLRQDPARGEEFAACVQLHAQRARYRGGAVASKDAYVTPFEATLWFKRQPNGEFAVNDVKL